MAAKILVESFYSQTIQTTMDTTSTSVNVDVAPVNSVGYEILEIGEANQEMIKHQALASLTLSSLLRGLSLTAATDTEVAGNKKTHAINDTIEQTNVHYFLNDKVSNAAEETIAGLKTFTLAPKASAAAAATTELMRYDETCRLSDNQTVNGIKTFGSIPVLPASDPTTDNQAARKAYVDSRPAARVSFTTYYVGENTADRDAIAREPLENTDGGSDGHIGRDAASNGVFQAQSFIAGSVASTFSMTVSLKKVGAPGDNLYIEIQGDSAGDPDGTPVANGTSNDVAAATIGAGYDDEAFTWASDPTLVAGTKYWAVIKRDGANSDANYYVAEYASNNAFRSGAMKKFTTVWTTNTGANDDMVFAISGVTATAVKAVSESYNSNRGRLGFLGFGNAAATIGNTLEIQTDGRMTGFTGLTPNSTYHVDSSAGAITSTNTDPIVGIALEATILQVGKAWQDFNEMAMVGEMRIWTTVTAPTGWLLCDGSAFDASVLTQYQPLFDVIGNTFGGADNTDFEVPDMRGNLPLGKDDMGQGARNRVTHANADTIGGEEGSETHTLVTGEIPSHSHNVNNAAGGAAGFAPQADAAMTAFTGPPTSSTGGGGAHENMSPYMTFAYIIKY